jgi:septal ring factor EnvC (AmiA/AmiB activator)
VRRPRRCEQADGLPVEPAIGCAGDVTHALPHRRTGVGPLAVALLGLVTVALGTFALALPLAVGAPPPPKEAATRQELEQAEKARAAQAAAQQQAAARAAQARDEELRLTAARIAAAQKLREAEDATAASATRMDMLGAQRRQAQAQLDQHAAAIRPLLPLIERLSLYPAETLLAVPAPPEDRVRGVLVLQALSRQLEREAESLRHDQQALDAATQAETAEAAQLAADRSTQMALAADLDRQIAAAQAQRAQAEAEAQAAAQRVAAEAARADSLKAVLATLETRRKAEEARAREEAARAERQKKEAEATAARERAAALARPTGAGTLASGAQPKSQLVAPVAGTVGRGWGEATDAGPALGISYNTPPSARVVSPCTGRVVFADAFRSYGLLLIVDCGGGYHAVMAGFDRLDVRIGQSVQAGEPVGVMPDWQPGSGGRHPSLYVELRHDGQPVNPAPWLKSNS